MESFEVQRKYVASIDVVLAIGEIGVLLWYETKAWDRAVQSKGFFDAGINILQLWEVIQSEDIISNDGVDFGLSFEQCCRVLKQLEP